MFASESKDVFQNPIFLLQMMIPLVIFFAVNFLLVRFIGKREGLVSEDTIALIFTTLARNSPLSLAIAVAAFPNRPLISLTLVIGPLIELPALSVVANLINRISLRWR
jgi:ACR3 family arsenite transporter